MGADVALDKNGNAVILTSRDYGAVLDHRIELLADADGPVHSAIMATQVAEHLLVGFLPPAFTVSRWLVRVFDGTSAGGGGYVGGTPDVVAPTVHSKFGSVATHYAVAGALGVVDIASNSVVSLLDFNTGAKILDIKTPSLPMTFEWMFRDEVYWQGNSNLVDDVGRWTPDAGAIDFINYGFDPNHGAADLGTDGTDMVWFDETGIDDAGAHAAMAYFTSPYAADPAKLVPRRLRSEIPNTNVGTPIAVGCGYAAFAAPAFVSGLRIVRLSDGWSWFLPNNPSWYWTQALALTCSEVFVRIYIAGPITTMARVALSQLGPGTPPD